MAYHCPMIDCGNGSYRLEKWKAKLCQIHQVSHESVDCSCQPPFSLHPLPTRKKKPSQRDKWIRLISREDTTADGRHKLFSPAKDARVCSRHFLDGNPTAENPFPTENLGYPGFQHKAARVLRDIPQPDHELGRRKRARRDLESQFEACQAQGSSREMDGAASGLPEECDSGPEQDPFATEKCLGAHVFAFYLLMVFFINRCRHMYRRYAHSLVAIVKLTKENNRLKRQVCVLKLQIANMAKKKNADRKKPRLFRNLISHKNVSYYTGMATTSLFRRIHGLVSPFVTRRWQGKVNHSKKARTFINQPMCFGPKRFLDSIDEMLLVFMRLRRGLDLEDLAYRFCISSCLAGKIFSSWVSALAATLGKMVYLPDEVSVQASKPRRYRDMPRLMGIIDCTELFIQTPQDIKFQSATWSEYKHHNTMKVLVSVLPNSMISFVSRAFEGRMSDRAATEESQFLKTIPPGSTLMADKGFSIADLCEQQSLRLEIPPGRRGQTQMPSAAVRKTKKIANRRILVEQVIRRLKTFRILSNELPISALHNIDDVILVCAALCNFKMSIYSD